MKYKVIDVVASEERYLPTSGLKGTRYDVVYEVEYWSWRKFKVVTDIKYAYRRAIGAGFRDSTSGQRIDYDIQELIRAYISVRGL